MVAVCRRGIVRKSKTTAVAVVSSPHRGHRRAFLVNVKFTWFFFIEYEFRLSVSYIFRVSNYV